MDSAKRAKLSGLAQKLEPIFQIGKNGIEPNTVTTIEEALEKRELIKINVLKTSDLDVKETLNSLCTALNAEPISAIGNKIVLYRWSKRKDIKHVII